MGETKPILSQIADLVAAIASLGWPLIAITLLWCIRHNIAQLISLTIKRIEGATDIEIGAIKIKGAIISQQGNVIKTDSEDVELRNARIEDYQYRGSLYLDAHHIHLVHTITPSDPREYVEGLVVWDVSVFLVPHGTYGKINDVKRVSYYLGDKWGPNGKYGSVFVVENGNNGFALTAKMYGAAMCVASIEFQDGSTYRAYRYLDVEMAPVFGVPPEEAR